LPMNVFRHDPQSRSMPFGDVCKGGASAEFYSPQAFEATVPCADLTSLRFCSRVLGDISLVDDCWQGFLAHANHRVVIRLPTSPPGIWYYAQTHLSDSAIIGWPCIEHNAGSVDGSPWFELKTQKDKPALFPIVDLGIVQAFAVKWRSPAWMRRHAPDLGHLCVAIRIFADGPSGPLVRIAAMNAFWQISRTPLADLAKKLDIDLTGCDTLFLTLMAMVMAILLCSEDEALDIVCLRVSSPDMDSAISCSNLDGPLWGPYGANMGPYGGAKLAP
jgi:hypothetical protein